MTEFLQMGGYAGYIWPAYGAALLIMGAIAVAVVRRNARVRAELAVLEARATRRKSERP